MIFDRASNGLCVHNGPGSMVQVQLGLNTWGACGWLFCCINPRPEERWMKVAALLVKVPGIVNTSLTKPQWQCGSDFNNRVSLRTLKQKARSKTWEGPVLLGGGEHTHPRWQQGPRSSRGSLTSARRFSSPQKSAALDEQEVLISFFLRDFFVHKCWDLIGLFTLSPADSDF